MRLIYVDESARGNSFYFIGALIADADAVRSIERGFDEVGQLVADHVPGFHASTEFHAAEMFHGEAAWNSVPIAWRVKACDLAAKVISRSSARFVFRGVDTAAQRARYGDRAFPAHLLTLAHALEEVDRKLAALDRPEQFGLVLADEHHSAPGARRSLRDFKIERVPGYTQRRLTRLADTTISDLHMRADYFRPPIWRPTSSTGTARSRSQIPDRRRRWIRSRRTFARSPSMSTSGGLKTQRPARRGVG